MTLYVDDLVCLVDPVVSIPVLLEYINSFRSISGYTINWRKSEFMPLTNQLTDDFLTKLPFRVTKECFTYLGLKLTKNPKHLFKFNFTESIEKLKTNTESWRILPLSMIGRVNAIKMVTLPRFLYLFQNLPIYLNASFFFKKLDYYIALYKGYKSHRYLRLTFKNLPKRVVGLPVFKLNTTTGQPTPELLPTGSMEALKLRRTLCGYSWKLLRLKCPHFLPFCFLTPPQ